MSRIIILFFSIILISCAGNPAPSIAPTDISQPPQLVEKGFATHIARASFPFGVEETRAFLVEDSRLLMAMEDTEAISGPVDFTLLEGEAWPEPGAVRRLKFADGHYAMERVIEYRPELFKYQVWGFTSSVSNNVAQIYGVQEIIPADGGGSELVWTYNVLPAAGWKKPFVNRFVKKEISQFLDGALLKVEAEANAMTKEEAEE